MEVSNKTESHPQEHKPLPPTPQHWKQFLGLSLTSKVGDPFGWFPNSREIKEESKISTCELEKQGKEYVSHLERRRTTLTKDAAIRQNHVTEERDPMFEVNILWFLRGRIILHDYFEKGLDCGLKCRSRLEIRPEDGAHEKVYRYQVHQGLGRIWRFLTSFSIPSKKSHHYRSQFVWFQVIFSLPITRPL